jgi:hypothetical protein
VGNAFHPAPRQRRHCAYILLSRLSATLQSGTPAYAAYSLVRWPNHATPYRASSRRSAPTGAPGENPVLDIANYERTDFVVADTRVETWPPKVRVSRWVEEVRSRVEAAAAILAKGSAS